VVVREERRRRGGEGGVLHGRHLLVVQDVSSNSSSCETKPTDLSWGEFEFGFAATNLSYALCTLNSSLKCGFLFLVCFPSVPHP